MGAVLLVMPARRLVCPNCSGSLLTRDPNPAHQVFHTCPGLHGMTAPLVEEGVACKVETVDRQDYEGADRAARDDEGNVVMAVRTTRDDGEDVLAFAPTATASIDELDSDVAARLRLKLKGAR